MGINEKDRLDDLRKRLYERGKPPTPSRPHQLTDEAKPLPTKWKVEPKSKTQPDPVPKSAPVSRPVPTPTPTNNSAATPVSQASRPGQSSAETTEGAQVAAGLSDTLKIVKKRRGYRLKLVLVGLLIFVISVMLSSIFLLNGTNVISGENIAISVTGPFTIGGGETLPIQVGVTNNNNVPIQAATLIVDYPDGTRSVNDANKDLFSERLPLDVVAPGETLNIPLRALVFGEENEEREVKVSIEYRVAGSNALFFKEAEPLKFKISSTPIRLSVESDVKISSGQKNDIVITVTSNSPTSISNILVKADYPTDFDYVGSKPEPSLAQNMWLIDELEPEETETITLTGIFYGKEAEEYAIDLSVGVPSERSPQNLASVFATEQIDFIIEQPFIGVDLVVNQQQGESVLVEPGEQFTASIKIENTLEESIYDTKIVAKLSGNALSQVDVMSRNGYYNSSNNTITWDVGSFEALQQISPGRSERVNFTVTPSSETDRTPQVDIDVSVSARRVSETQAAEQLVGAASTVVKVISEPTLASDVGHNNSVYRDTGPIPPVADTPTTYTVSFMVENGSNEITNAEVTASLPPYVQWIDKSSGSGSMSFNSVNRTLTWNVGDVAANTSVFGNFQISFQPSQNQIGETPTLIDEQRLKATDRFTGSTVRDTARALSAELSTEAGFGSDSGRVVAPD